MQQAQFASQGRAAPALDEAAVERLMVRHASSCSRVLALRGMHLRTLTGRLLKGLGFDRARVEVALAQSHNDPDVAANLLLMSA